MKSKMIRARTFLALQFFIHCLKKIFRIGRRNKNHFLKSYKGDGIFAISRKHRKQMPDYSRCHLCRICDVACPEVSLRTDFLAPSFVVAGFSRSLTDFALLSDNFECDSCKLCEQSCPQNIPIREILGFMHSANL